MEVWSIVSLPISVDLVELEIVKAIESNLYLLKTVDEAKRFGTTQVKWMKTCYHTRSQ